MNAFGLVAGTSRLLGSMEFLEIMHYVRSLGFEQEPDYDFIIGQIEKCAKRLKISLKVPDFNF